MLPPSNMRYDGGSINVTNAAEVLGTDMNEIGRATIEAGNRRLLIMVQGFDDDQDPRDTRQAVEIFGMYLVLTGFEAELPRCLKWLGITPPEIQSLSPTKEALINSFGTMDADAIRGSIDRCSFLLAWFRMWGNATASTDLRKEAPPHGIKILAQTQCRTYLLDQAEELARRIGFNLKAIAEEYAAKEPLLQYLEGCHRRGLTRQQLKEATLQSVAQKLGSQRSVPSPEADDLASELLAAAIALHVMQQRSLEIMATLPALAP